MSGQPSLMRMRSCAGTPEAFSISISSTSACGESTTPPPIRQSTPSCNMPEGMRCRIVFLPSMTTV